MTLKNVWFDPLHETVRFTSEVVNINHTWFGNLHWLKTFLYKWGTSSWKKLKRKVKKKKPNTWKLATTVVLQKILEIKANQNPLSLSSTKVSVSSSSSHVFVPFITLHSYPYVFYSNPSETTSRLATTK